MMSYGRGSRAWQLDLDEAVPIVQHAVESGVTFFDTADMYSQGRGEEITGKLLSDLFRSRDEYVLATKVYYPTGAGPNDHGLSRKHIMASIDASLARLGTDYVDLYQIHRWDEHTPIEETMSALHDVVCAGKARYIGASSMFAWQFAKAQYVSRMHEFTSFVSMQNHYNLLYREEEREMIPFCLDDGVAVLPYSPLARGLLAGNRGRGDVGATVRATSDPVAARMYGAVDDEVVAALRAVAQARGVARAQVALAWLLAQPGVVAPVVGATRREHLDDALGALVLRLDEEEAAALETGYRPHPVVGHPDPRPM
jgi:1-deoxyxylulose-5-phosphate synthase